MSTVTIRWAAGRRVVLLALGGAFLAWVLTSKAVLAQQPAGKKPALSDVEVAMLKAFNSTLSVHFDAIRFKDTINYIEDKTKGSITFAYDEDALKEAKFDVGDPVVFRSKKITVRALLRKITSDRKLGYYIEDTIVTITTAEKAEQQTLTRLYPVANLIGAGPNQAANVQALIALVQDSVEPKYWKLNGGPGKMNFVPQIRSIAVVASQEVHYLIGSSGLLRNGP